MQQPIRKAVGRPADARKRLAQVEQLNAFISNMPQEHWPEEKLIYPERKAVVELAQAKVDFAAVGTGAQ